MNIYTSALVLAWIAILLLAFAMAGILRQVNALSGSRSIAPRLGPAIGEVAPSWNESAGPPTRTTVVLFVDNGCASCDRVLRTTDQLAEQYSSQLDFIAFFRGTTNGYQPSHVEAVEEARPIFDRYRVPVTPFGVVINSEGRVADAAALGSERAVNDLIVKAFKLGGSNGTHDR